MSPTFRSFCITSMFVILYCVLVPTAPKLLFLVG